ncbi:MAG: helix-turn-helix transcriptional regulator [bacterium]|nr:helix-turn-helix transcriptional regulator [bacterium]
MSKYIKGNLAKKEVGRRFRRFRESIEKAQYELAEELGISQSTIANIERGKAFPNINYLHNFYHKYNLNINWLITGEGEMLTVLSPVNAKYFELFNLMQIPSIEHVILAKLIELKALLREEVRDFLDNPVDEKVENSG